jgi:hypothetical protein
MRLLPGKTFRPHCELFIAKISEAPPYEALSYVWGEPSEEKRTLMCGDKFLKITQNLKDALVHMRRESDIRIVWADAVCINQNDDTERGHQVNRMAQVYETASRVLIWLGWLAPNKLGVAEEAFSLISDLNRKCGEIHAKHRMDYAPPLEPDSPLRTLSRWESVKKLYKLPWFYRVWVLQEVGLAATALVFWGCSSIRWSEIVEFSCFLSFDIQLGLAEHTRLLDDVHAGVTKCYEQIWVPYGNTRTWRKEMPYIKYDSAKYESTPSTFLNILNTGRDYEATDPRDNVFAFLGHPAARVSEGAALIDADYTHDVDITYQKVAIAIVAQEKSPAILSYVWHGDNDLESGNLSWVPNWSWGPRNLLPRVGREKFYNAGLVSKYDSDHFVEHVDSEGTFKDVRGRNLHTRGILFDSIRAFSQEMKWDDFRRKTGTPMDAGGITNPLESAWTLATAAEAYPYSCDKETAFSLTVTCGVNEIRHDWERDKKLVEAFRKRFKSYRQGFFTPSDSTLQKGLSDRVVMDKAYEYTLFTQYSKGRKFFVTKDGRFGLGPPVMKQGDLCCVLFGSIAPFIIRPTGIKSHYQLVGECYVHGIMRGEIIQEWERGKKQVEDIVFT